MADELSMYGPHLHFTAPAYLDKWFYPITSSQHNAKSYKYIYLDFI